MRNEFPQDKIAIATVFPDGTSRDMLHKVLTDRWGVKNVPGYIDEDSGLFRKFEIRGVPSSALYNAQGELVKFYEGFPGEDEIRAALQSVVKK